MDNDKKNSKNNNLILLKSIIKETYEDIELNEEETKLKNKLMEIENKLNSVENVILSMDKDKNDSIFNSDAFSMLVGSIAITAAINAIGEYFDVKSDDITKIFDK